MSGLSLIDVWYRRLPRYLFIEDRLRDQAVLELGCGSGLGADFLIEQGAARVVGLDVDERQILKARARYKRPNLSFEVSSGPELPFADGEFDVVLIPEGSRAIADQTLLAAVRRVLRPEGLCLLAAPNGDIEEPDSEGLSYYDMIESLEPVFPTVTMVAQTPMLAFTFVDFVASAEELDVGLDDSLAQDLVDDVAYYVALCSTEAYSPEQFAITQVPFAPVARRVQHLLDGQPPEQLELGELQEALAAEREERIRQADSTGELERDLLESQNIMRDLRARLAEADEQQVAADARLGPLEDQLAELARGEEVLVEKAEGLRRERDGLREQAERYAQRAEEAEQAVEAARHQAGELQQRAESYSAAQSELDTLRNRYEQGEQKYDILSAALTDEQTRADRLESRRDEATAALETAERELASARESEENYNRRVSELEAELDGVKQALAGRSQQIAELERELGEVREGAEQGGHRIVVLERELGELRDQAEERTHRTGALERELSEVRDQADQRQHHVEELERELGEVHEAADQRAVRVEALERELGEVRGDVEGRGQRVDEVERELSAVRSELDERGVRVGELEHELGEVRSELDQRGERVGELEWELGEVRADVEARGHRVGELEQNLQEVHEEISQRKQRTGELKRQVELAERGSESLREQVGELERTLDELRSDSGEQQEQAQLRIEQLQQQITEAESALEAAQQQCSGLEDRLQEAQSESASEAARLQDRLSESQQEHEGLSERLEGLESGLDASREEVRTLGVQLDQGRQEAADRAEELQEAESRLAELTAQLSETEDQARSFKGETERIQQQLLGADAQRAAQDGAVRELERELATARADRGSLEVRLEQALIRADQSEVSGQQDRQRQEDLETRLIAELEESRAAQAQTRTELGDRQNEAESQLAELENRNRELDRLSTELGDRQNEAESQLAELENRNRELDRLSTELEEERARAEAQGQELEAARDTASRTQEELASLRSAMAESRAVADQQETDRAHRSSRLEQTLRDAEERAATLETHAQGLATRLAEQESQTHGVQDRLRSVADALSAREETIKTVMAQLALQQGDGAAQGQQLADARGELEALEQALGQERQVREEIEGSLDSVEASMRELSSAGERAVEELDIARRHASEQTTEATEWRSRCEEVQRELQQTRDHSAALEAARDEVDSDETVRQMRSELEAVRTQGAALGGERLRLLREASLAEGAKDAVAGRLAAAERANQATARGMELVIARLESERERADALDREVKDLRARQTERGDFAVKVTREAAAEAQKAQRYRRELAETSAQAESLRAELDRRAAELQEAREAVESAATPPAPAASTGADLAPVIRRLEQRTTELQAAQAQIRELSDQLGAATADQQELRRANAQAAQAGPDVSDWDADIERTKRQSLAGEREALQAQIQEREAARRELEDRLKHQAERVQELLAGAEQHRLEMADREIALAEQAAFNAELEAAGTEGRAAVEAAVQAQEHCETRLAQAQSEAKALGAEVARLEGLARRSDAELEALRAGGEAAADSEALERAVETAIQEAAAFKQRFDDTSQLLFEREDRIEELEALLELAKAARSRAKTAPKKRETLIGIGPDTQEIPPYRPPEPTVDLDALRQALDEVKQIEKTCQVEEERIGVLATSLTRLGEQAGTVQEQLDAERRNLAEVERQRSELASQAARLPELELELEVLRSQSANEPSLGQLDRAEITDRLLEEQKQLAEDAVQHSERRVTELNNTIGDKDAEILLLHASRESMQKHARQLAANIQEALRGAGQPDAASASALLNRLSSELEKL